MQNDYIKILSNITNPLLFASKNNFSNLNKIKNLQEIVNDSCTKVLSLNPSKEIIDRVNLIKIAFSDFERSNDEIRKEKIRKTLNILNDLGKLDLTDKEERYEDNKEYNNQDMLGKDVRYLKGVGPKLSSILNKRSITTIEDLIFYSPKRYDDRRNISKISNVKLGESSTIIGEILLVNEVKNKKFKFFQVVITDNSSRLKLIWFNYNVSYLRSVFKKGLNVIVHGNINYNSYDRSLQIIHPSPEDIEIIDNVEDLDTSLQFNRIVPIYPLTEGLTQKKLRNLIYTVLEQHTDNFNELISKELMDKFGLLNVQEALKLVHFPFQTKGIVNLDDRESVYNSKSHKTVIFFEFFVLELGLAFKKKRQEKSKGISFNTSSRLVEKLIESLPFKLTSAQTRVISEIDEDMESSYPMSRLLQGDVGSGKTIVALISILKAIECGYQAVLMVPTEILAEQHYNNIKRITDNLGINICLLKSALKKKEKSKVYNDIQNGKSDLIVGTHALLEEDVIFKNLGFVVIDEQHRFGVVQRAKLIGKANNSDVLIMTATPIPRTLAITVYGDLDISVIDELPPDRKNIKTLAMKDTDNNRQRCYEIVKEELSKGRQAYFVYPFIDESENPDFKNIRYAIKMAEDLQNEVFQDYKVGLLHGKMSSEEKEDIMQKFLSNKYHILVSTTVIEVGVDVSNATIMVIENAERFGLSQMHQLRGRIGRGQFESKCILISSYKTGDDSEKRLKIMKETDNGFRISEADLEIRGPGDFMGTKQSGIPAFKFANLIRDSRILNEARSAAFEIINNKEFHKEHKTLMNYVINKWGELLELKSIT